jgi:hypothetical protein
MTGQAGSVVAQVILASTFGAAGAAKLRAGGAQPTDLRALGIPVVVANRVRWTLPVAELGIAALLAWQPAARIGGAAAAALLCLFSAVVATALRSGRRVVCACFGIPSHRTVGPRHLVRNVALIGAAALVVAAPPALPPGPPQWLVIAVTIILVQAWFLVPRAGASTPPATSALPVLARPLAELGLGSRPVVAVFVDPHCGPCQRLLASATGWREALAGAAAVVLVSSDPLTDNPTIRRAVDVILPDPGRRLAAALNVQGTPAALRLDPGGTPVGPPALGVDAVRETLGVPPPAPDARALPLRPAVPRTLGRDPGTGTPVLAADPDGRWTVVLRTTHSCADCADTVVAARRQVEPRHRLVLLGPPDDVDNPGLVVDDHAFAHAVGLRGAPAVVVLDAAGQLLAAAATGTALTLATLEALGR